MNQGTVWGVVIVILLVVAGLFVWRSAGINGEPVPLPTVPAQASPLPTSGQITTSPFFSPAPSPLPGSPSPAASPVAGATTPGAATIALTDTGFTPATITIPAGTTVTFINNGQAAHWPASAVHPTHQALPGFDSLRGLSTGETYSFTFDTAGSWSFHDHLNPQFTGTIIVQ